MVNLACTYAGLNLKNPIVMASSGLTATVENVKELVDAGAGAIVLKSIFEEEILMEMEQSNQEMIGRPYIYPETMDYMDEADDEDLIRKYLGLIKDCKANTDVPIIASINCVSNQKWIYLAKEIEKAGADAIELNIFSLPSDTNHAAGEIENAYIEIVDSVVALISIPLTIKISPFFTSLAQMIHRFESMGVKGIVMFNRFYAPDINITDQALSSSFVLSNPSDIALPMRWIALMAEKVNVDFAATTGIHHGSGAVKMFLAGASVVQIASTVYKNGPKVIEEIKQELSQWMVDNDYKSLSEFKGKLSLNAGVQTAAWERVQFMREFRHFVK